MISHQCIFCLGVPSKLTQLFAMFRPMVNQHHQRNQTYTFRQPAFPMPNSAELSPYTVDDEARFSIWSSSQRSDLRPTPIREDSAENRLAFSGESPLPEDYDHRRAKSHGELKIVIDRPTTGESSNRGPGLDVSMPPSRLDKFGFQAEIASHSSAYARASTSHNFGPYSAREDSFTGRRRSNDQASSRPPSFVLPVFPVSRSLSGFANAPTRSTVFYKLKEPIEPSIFDTLSFQMDDPSVVRYLRGTNQITAATPARIVAQISSDSFMDYELVSDFFLTFRSYLSLSNLLSLLLARLEWAIDRLEDDGRIIRIRAFAALRHWILNYFVDDFVANRSLRVQFCDRINKLYDDVKSRRNEKASDLKIVIDLKRCWNGRCSLYWSDTDFSSDSHPDNDVLPGRVDAPDWSCFQPQYQQASAQATLSGSGYNRTYPLDPSTLTSPLSPSSTAPQRIPVSSPSGTSAQVGSCSILPMVSRSDSSRSNGPRGLHPVPVTTRKSSGPLTDNQAPISPVWHRAIHAHKRSGSFTDSFRDGRAPLPNSDGHLQLNAEAMEYPDSVIRGNVYGPLDAHVVVAPPSPAFEVDHVDLRGEVPEAGSGGTARGSEPAGKKNFIDSIRKVLHSRQGGSQGGGPISPQWTRGRTSTLPSNIAIGSDNRRARRGGPLGKGHPRLDRLGEEALLSYQRLLDKISRNSQNTEEAQLESEQKETVSTVNSNSGAPSGQRTTGSKSISTIDDTGMEVPAMSGALRSSMLVETEQPDATPNDRLQPGDGRCHTPNPNSEPSANPNPEGQSLHTDPNRLSESQASASFSPYSANRSSSLPREPFKPSTMSLTERLRKYTSYHSNWGVRSASPDGQCAQGSLSRSNSLKKSLKPISRILRRRPGGDLRKMQHNGHLPARHSMASFVSGTSHAGSGRDSVLYMGAMERDNNSRHASLPVRQPYSLIQEPSTQNMRRSFEAAVARFARIPDDDDGGIESALLKLEGKWEPNSSPTAEYGRPSMESRLRYVENYDSDERPTHQENYSNYPAGDTEDVRATMTTGYFNSYVESESSYCSIPLLERGLADDSMKAPAYRQPLPEATPNSQLHSQGNDAEPSHPSIEVVEKTQSMRQIPRGSTLPKMPTPKSAAHDHNEDGADGISEISSEISIDVIDGTEAAAGISPTLQFPSVIPPHPLVHPTSLPKTLQPLNVMGSFTQPPRTAPCDSQPLSPSSIRTARNELTQSQSPRYSMDMIGTPPSAFSNHVPYILGHDSRTLAQQFTLIEQAALSEVDWRDLVEMRWSQSSQSTFNWVEYLAEEDRKGIDIVVARFNLMVKWAVSEIVLTQSTTERAQVMIKLIHVAVHARKLCNYATMLQITIALSSVDCTRLVKTWELVPEGEKQLLKDMEPLVQPVRNFHKLRMEMETSTLQNGCIPFVGECYPNIQSIAMELPANNVP